MGNTEDVSGAGSEAAEPKRRSPAEAFDELKATVNRSAKDISDLWDFAQKVKGKLVEAAELQRLDGMLPVLDSLLQIHQILFVRVKAAAGTSDDSNGAERFVATLLETVEDELKRHGVDIVKPARGTPFDVQLMECSVAVKPETAEHAANTVAAVTRCGFLYRPPTGPKRLVSKAQVEVFRND